MAKANWFFSNVVRQDFFFYLLDYVTRRSEKLGFQKKKKKGFCLIPLGSYMFFGFIKDQ